MGSIEKIKDSSGKIIAARARWRDPAGDQHKKLFKGPAPVGRATKHLADVESAKNQGSYVDITSKTTVAEYARRWIDARPYRTSALEHRNSQWSEHIEPTKLGRMRLVDVRHTDVQHWATERSAVLGAASVRHVLGLVRSVLSAAATDRLINRSPVGRVFLPPAELTPVVPLTVAQARAVAERIPARFRGLVLAQSMLGVRVGELLAIRVQDIDTEAQEVSIREQLHPRLRHRMPTKTPFSVRVLPLPKTCADAIADHLRQFPANADGYVFTNAKGLPFQAHTYNTAVVNAAKSLKMPRTTTHDFRHHYASVLLAAGESVVTVAARLGHANATEVIKTYGHLMPNSEETTRRAVDSAWRAPDVPQPEETPS